MVVSHAVNRQCAFFLDAPANSVFPLKFFFGVDPNTVGVDLHRKVVYDDY